MKRNITITLDKAREWYNSGDESLKEAALQAFSKKELDAFDFTKIKTFDDALKVLGYNEYKALIVNNIIVALEDFSKASAAMFKLNIIRKALNLGQDLHLTKEPKDSYIYYPYNPFLTERSTFYKNEIKSGEMEIIGKIKSEKTLYNVFGGDAYTGVHAGLGYFCSAADVSFASINIGFLGCATKEIAQHFGKYFGMLITEAKYGDMVDFDIIENKYK